MLPKPKKKGTKTSPQKNSHKITLISDAKDEIKVEFYFYRFLAVIQARLPALAMPNSATEPSNDLLGELEGLLPKWKEEVRLTIRFLSMFL